MSKESRRRLLIITHYFPPCAAVAVHRVLGFARHLPASGWDVSVVAPTYDKWEPSDEALVSRVPEHTVTVRIEQPVDPLSRIASRLLPYEIWQMAAWRRICRHVRDWRPDAILTTSPPDSVHIMGHRLKKRFGVRWIADLRDPFVRSQAKEGGRGLYEHVAMRCAAMTMANADHVCVNTPAYAGTLAADFPEHATKISVYTNGHDMKSGSSRMGSARGH